MQLLKRQFFPKVPRFLFYTIFIFILLSFGASFLKYYFFLYNGLDLALFNHTLWQTVNGSFFASSINPPSYLGDHFAPFLLLLLPFYKLVPSPLTLLFLQTIFIGLSTIPLYAIVRRGLSKQWTILIILSWLANPFIGSLALFEFHIISVFPLLFLSLWYFFITQKKWPFIITLILSLLVREDAGIALSGLAIVMLIYGKRNFLPYYYGLITLAAALLWTPIALHIVSTFALDGSYKFYAYYGWLGDMPIEIIKNSITSPLLILSHIFTLDTLTLFFILLLPVLYLSLLAPLFLIAAFPSLLLLLLTTEGGTPLIPFLHYNAWFMPAIYLATFSAIKKLRSPQKNQFLSIFHEKQYFIKALLGISFIYFFFALNPITKVYYAAATNWGELYADRLTKQILLTKIAPDDEVITTADFLTQLSSRTNIHYLRYLYSDRYQLSEIPYEFPNSADVLLFRPTDLMYYNFLSTSLSPGSIYDGEKLDMYIREMKFSPSIITNDYILFRKNQSNFFDYHKPLEILPDSAIPNTSSEEEELSIVGWETIHPTEEFALATIYVTANNMIDDSLFLKIVLFEEDTVLETIIIPPSLGLVTTKRWTPNTLYASRILIPLHRVDSEALTKITITPVKATVTYSLDQYTSGTFILDTISEVGQKIIIPLEVQSDK